MFDGRWRGRHGEKRGAITKLVNRFAGVKGERMAWWEDFFDAKYVEAWTAAGSFDDTAEEVDALEELLGVGPRASILDVGCGFGRFAGPLAERGYEVTGIDSSPDQLALARDRHPGPTYVHGDMRHPPAGEFDAAINVYSTFGYFDDPADDVAAVDAWAQALRPGGVLVMELMHRDRLAALFDQPVEHRGPVEEVGETDWVSGVRTSTVTFAGIEKTFRVRLYTVTDLVRMLHQAGFRTVDAYGGLRGGQVTPHTRLALRAVR
jgi:SAM-dependent methyltransferase